MNEDKPLKEIILEGTDKSYNDNKPDNSGLIKPIVLALVLIGAFTIPVQAHYSPDKSNCNMLTQQKNYSLNQQYEINKHPYEIPKCDSSGYLK
ncbi:hypothetical protein COY26_05310 [Candidatus Woesearchaeota archaeon CG_4_10_14_0_2_um_filter_33_10]|nr:MAG: hypothetical protein AUJ83_02610 [Candidatus Woesearchaeota archaeon CG1_02_33_12]PIN78307.1 MAG: hypothetical protein COV14_04055 [Candidatus Woesearchaeota archaeon CG10_big_fil_rev_8_21_14_0_10_33_12]PIZ51943.1 MAG: hypothetical protein COY26_05310 [Candidatus Woesearchaeota archaeon CG_4_10_14_0_2_um_filter_33_10]